MSGFSFAAERPIEKYHKSDILFLISVILLWGLGFFALFICSQNYAQRMFDDSFYFVKRQFITSCVGGILFLFFLLSDIKYIRKLVSIIVISAFVLCLLTFIPGISVEKNGAARWIRLPFSFSFQLQLHFLLI
jgi:cell division protein FtsW